MLRVPVSGEPSGFFIVLGGNCTVEGFGSAGAASPPATTAILMHTSLASVGVSRGGASTFCCPTPSPFCKLWRREASSLGGEEWQGRRKSMTQPRRRPGSPAYRAGVRAGFLLMKLNDRHVRSSAEVPPCKACYSL